MEVLSHLTYEYHKKLRSLALYTFNSSRREEVEQWLCSRHIDYILQEVTPLKYNVFFGDTPCLDVIRHIGGDKPLAQYTPEEDFMLGIMLGYDRVEQCRRYQKRVCLSQK
ncbi:MAG: DUF2023 family protein [Bacteroidales bacterium]|uniref:DUF2023 family protein n=1 Tax=Porphyromonas sp. TaxID=1924944 RepID=UPI0029763229|nr:DUF2023 family protein [Porphyromonas sp.]MDD7437585.1 DUF2023 family protein [Bacteroidales bacterium]MDY3067830.1 DUF2023 family protein [Porphyromonas sp.]